MQQRPALQYVRRLQVALWGTQAHAAIAQALQSTSLFSPQSTHSTLEQGVPPIGSKVAVGSSIASVSVQAAM